MYRFEEVTRLTTPAALALFLQVCGSLRLM